MPRIPAIDFDAAGGVDLDRLERSLALHGERVEQGRYRVSGEHAERGEKRLAKLHPGRGCSVRASDGPGG